MASQCKIIVFTNYLKNKKVHYIPHTKKLNSHIQIEEYRPFYFYNTNKSYCKIMNAKTLFTKIINGHRCYYADTDVTYFISFKKSNKSKIIKLQIIPIPITNNERMNMIRDLENFSTGITRENIKGSAPTYSYTSQKTDYINDNMFKKLSNNSVKLINTFRLIQHNPSNLLINKYPLKRVPKELNFKSLKKDITHNNIHKKHSKVNVINYNTEENRWIKLISKKFIKYLSFGLKRFANKYKILNYEYKIDRKFCQNRSRTENKHNKNYFHLSKLECNNIYLNLKRLYNYLFYFNHKTIFKNINDNITYTPKKLILSPKYNNIYKTYQNILHDKITLKKQMYKYLAKPTQNLYEMWTTLITIKALKKIGFTLSKYNTHSIHEPLIKGEKFYLYKRNIRLIVIYNKIIKNKGEKLISRTKKNRPDIRIDIFRNNHYIGSFILDAKFMFARNIKNHLKQFKSYKYGFRSYTLHFNNKTKEILQHLEYHPIGKYPVNPIRYVFALFPNYDPHKSIRNQILNTNIFSYQKLTPGKNIEDFEKNLHNDLIKSIKLYNNYL